MWTLIRLPGAPLYTGMDATSSANAFRDLNAAATSISANRKVVEQVGIQTGEKIVASQADTAIKTLDQLDKQAEFKECPEVTTAKVILEKVKSGGKLDKGDLDKLMNAMQCIEAKLLKPVQAAIAKDMQAALGKDGTIDAQKEKAIEDKYQKLGVNVNVLNKDELKAMGQKETLVAYKITSAGAQTTGPVQTSSQKVTLGQPEVKPSGPPQYQKSPHAATVEKYWDDGRHTFLKQNAAYFIRPEGGIHTGGLPGPNEQVTAKLKDGTPVPTLQNAILDDFKRVKGKFSGPEDLQAAIKVGYGKPISLEDAATLFSFIENGKPSASGGSPTKPDVGELQRILGSLKADYNDTVKKSGGYDKLYGFATTETVRKMAEVLGDLQVPKTETVPPPTVTITGFEEHVAPPTYQVSKDANYLVDNSGSMGPKLESLFKIINNVNGVNDSQKKVIGTFGSGDNKMTVATSGTIKANQIEKSDHAKADQQKRNLEQVDKAMNGAFSLVAGNPPTAKGLQAFAQCFGVAPADLEKCLSADKKSLDLNKFRDLSMPGYGKDNKSLTEKDGGGQESGLKNALVALMTNEQYSTGKKHELIITTDEPEHAPQYLDLVKLLAQQKGVDIKIIALPTSGSGVSMENFSENMKKAQTTLDGLVEKRDEKVAELEAVKNGISPQLQEDQKAIAKLTALRDELEKANPDPKSPTVVAKLKLTNSQIATATNFMQKHKETAINKLNGEIERSNNGIAVQQANIAKMEQAIRVVDLNSIDSNWVKSHYDGIQKGFPWSASQHTMGLQLQ